MTLFLYCYDLSMSNHRLCKKCQKPIILIPSATERAKKYGETAKYYLDLFQVCTECTIKSWYER